LVKDQINFLGLNCQSGYQHIAQSHSSNLEDEVIHEWLLEIKSHESDYEHAKELGETKKRMDFCNPSKEVYKAGHYNCYSNGSSLVQDQLKLWAAKCSSGSQLAMLSESSKKDNKKVHTLSLKEEVTPLEETRVRVIQIIMDLYQRMKQNVERPWSKCRNFVRNLFRITSVFQLFPKAEEANIRDKVS
jgi:hypothetical protein